MNVGGRATITATTFSNNRAGMFVAGFAGGAICNSTGTLAISKQYPFGQLGRSHQFH